MSGVRSVRLLTCAWLLRHSPPLVPLPPPALASISTPCCLQYETARDGIRQRLKQRGKKSNFHISNSQSLLRLRLGINMLGKVIPASTAAFSFKNLHLREGREIAQWPHGRCCGRRRVSLALPPPAWNAAAAEGGRPIHNHQIDIPMSWGEAGNDKCQWDVVGALPHEAERVKKELLLVG